MKLSEMPRCGATSQRGDECMHPVGHRGCHEVWTEGSTVKADHRWWGDHTFENLRRAASEFWEAWQDAAKNNPNS